MQSPAEIYKQLQGTRVLYGLYYVFYFLSVLL